MNFSPPRSSRRLLVILLVLMGLTLYSSFQGRTMSAAVAPVPNAPRGPSIIVSPFQFEVVHNPAPQVTGDVLSLQNMGFNWLDWNIGEYSDTSCSVPLDLTWLSVDQFGGILAPNEATFINVTFDSSVVPDGDYTGSLCVFSNDPFNPVVPVYSRLIVAYPVPTKVPTKVPPTPTEVPPTKVPPTPTEEPVPPTKVPPTPTDVPPTATEAPLPSATPTPPPVPTTLPTRTPRVSVTATQTSPDLVNQRYLPLTRRR